MMRTKRILSVGATVAALVIGSVMAMGAADECCGDAYITTQSILPIVVVSSPGPPS